MTVINIKIKSPSNNLTDFSVSIILDLVSKFGLVRLIFDVRVSDVI